MKSEAGVIFSVSMAKITRLSGRSDWIELEFVERERTPSKLMQVGIRLHVAEISLLNTIRKLEKFGVERSRKASTIGCKKPIYSQPTMRVRITSRSTNR